MTPSSTPTDAITMAIHKGLHDEVARIVQEEADAASKRVVERVKAETARIAAKVISWQRMEFRRDEIVVTIQIPKELQ